MGLPYGRREDELSLENCVVMKHMCVSLLGCLFGSESIRFGAKKLLSGKIFIFWQYKKMRSDETPVCFITRVFFGHNPVGIMSGKLLNDKIFIFWR
jgi:hypothetical protein